MNQSEKEKREDRKKRRGNGVIYTLPKGRTDRPTKSARRYESIFLHGNCTDSTRFNSIQRQSHRHSIGLRKGRLQMRGKGVNNPPQKGNPGTNQSSHNFNLRPLVHGAPAAQWRRHGIRRNNFLDSLWVGTLGIRWANPYPTILHLTQLAIKGKRLSALWPLPPGSRI